MSEYNKYVSAINKIFECTNKMKENWKNSDNISYIENIEEYKQVVIESAKLFENNTPISQPPMEELGDD